MLHAHQRRDAGVDASELQGDPSAEDGRGRKRLRLGIGEGEDAELGKPFDDEHRELGPGPVVVDDRFDLGLEVVAEAHHEPLLVVGEGDALHTVEVADEGREHGGGEVGRRDIDVGREGHILRVRGYSGGDLSSPLPAILP